MKIEKQMAHVCKDQVRESTRKETKQMQDKKIREEEISEEK